MCARTASLRHVIGDFVADLVVGTDNSDTNPGRVYVVYGRNGTAFPSVVPAATLNGTNGLVINGINDIPADNAGRSVASGHDVNGDGLGDIAIGAIGGDPENRAGAGQVHVVFGSAAFPAELNLSTLNGSNGFTINGDAPSDQLGDGVTIEGDLNGDGLFDVVAGAAFSEAAFWSLPAEVCHRRPMRLLTRYSADQRAR